MSEEFRLRSVAVAAYGPATLFGLAEGSMLPVITLSAIGRGASTPAAALIGALLGIGSIVTNIPSGILATRIGERKAMLVAAIATAAGLAFCLADLGRGPGPLLVYGFGVLLIGSASSVYSLARQSYLTEMVPPHMRARALSTRGGAVGLDTQAPRAHPASGRDPGRRAASRPGGAPGSRRYRRVSRGAPARRGASGRAEFPAAGRGRLRWAGRILTGDGEVERWKEGARPCRSR